MRITILLLFFLSYGGIFITLAQSENKDVTITASGSGKTLEEARQSALRSATEQAFGAFISSKTEMFNDQVVADQMASVSSGNIKSYEVLNEARLPDGRWGVTLRAIVSVDKLTSFVQAKGISVDIKGGLFAMNIKQQMLNEEGEVKVICEMIGMLHEPMQTVFDYTIKSGEPKSLDGGNKNWKIPLEVTAIANKNMDICANYFIKTLNALSLSNDEVKNYKVLGKKVYPVTVGYEGSTSYFFFRKEMSIYAINTFTCSWEFYTRLFVVQSGKDEAYGKGEGRIHKFNVKDKVNKYVENGNNIITNIDGKNISFLSAGQIGAIFNWQEERTLAQIEQISSFLVKPRGVISKYQYGGFVLVEIEKRNQKRGLIASICDIGYFNFRDAQKACEELVLNGYSDWVLPSKIQLQQINYNLFLNKLGGIADRTTGSYWSSENTPIIPGSPSLDGRKQVGWFSDDYFGFGPTFPSEFNLVRPVRVYKIKD